MTQPTRQFVPVQRDAAPRQGEAQFDLSPAHSNLTNNILTFAQQHNVANMQEAKAALYLEGQIQASQGKGVEELRANTPWYQKMFGHGATVSGAMDYTVQKAVFDYGNSVDENMDAHRKMTPEAFVAQQTGQIERYMGEDGPTNTAIYNAMSQALPDAARKQAKAFKGYEQELMVHSMSGAIAAGLTSVNKAQQGDADDRVAAVSAFGTVLAKHPGMTDEAYKNTLFNMAALEATEYGTGMLADRIEDLGYARTPEERAQLLKVREVAEGKMVENSAVQIAFMKERMTSLAASETPMVNILQEFNDARDIYGNSAFGETVASSVLTARARYLGEQVKAQSQAQADEAVRIGQGHHIADPTLQRKAIENSRLRAKETGDWDAHYFALNSGALTDTVLKGQLSTAFSAEPRKHPETGRLTATVDQEQTLMHLQHLKQHSPDVYYRHIDEDTAMKMQLYNLFDDEGQTAGEKISAVRAVVAQYPQGVRFNRAEEEKLATATKDITKSEWWQVFGGGMSNIGAVEAELRADTAAIYRATGGSMESAVEAAKTRFVANNIKLKNQTIPAAAADWHGVAREDMKGVIDTAAEYAGVSQDNTTIIFNHQNGEMAVYAAGKQLTTLDMDGAAEVYHAQKEVDAAKAAALENDKQAALYAAGRKVFAEQYFKDSQEYLDAWEDYKKDMPVQMHSYQRGITEEQFFRTWMKNKSSSEIILAADLAEIAYTGLTPAKQWHHDVGNILRDTVAFLKGERPETGIELTAEQRQGLAQTMITPGTLQRLADVADAEAKKYDQTKTSAYNSLGEHLNDPTPAERGLFVASLRLGTPPPAAKTEYVKLSVEGMTRVEVDLYTNEAAIARVYGDPKKIPTVGIGAALVAESVTPATKKFFAEEFGFGDEMFPPHGGDFSGWADVRLTDGQIKKLFRANLMEFDKLLSRDYKDPELRDALMPIVYQNGRGAAQGSGAGAWEAGKHLRTFLKTGASEDAQNAIAEYINSDWYRTYPRAQKTVQHLMEVIGMHHFN